MQAGLHSYRVKRMKPQLIYKTKHMKSQQVISQFGGHGRRQVNEQVSRQVRGQVYWQVYEQVREQVYEQVHGQVYEQVHWQVRGQVYNHTQPNI
jgi:hypothetical protein